MITGITIWGLCLLWIGAVSFGCLLLLRSRWEQAMIEGVPMLRPQFRKVLEAVLLFSGSGGSILGLGFLALGVMR